MISFKSSKALGLVLASAGILLNAHSTLAADILGDAQMQARELLSVGERSKAAQVAAVISADDAHAFNVEPQEQARQLILGKPTGDRVADRVVGSDLEMTAMRRVQRAASDPQEAARRMVQAKGV
jgi:hypothetical protein